MAKTLRVRTAAGWVTKPVADTPANRLTAEEVDDNFLALENEKLSRDGGELVRYSETTAAATASVDRADGGKQTLDLNAIASNVTLTVAITAGEDLELTILGGNTYSVTWPVGDWLGGAEPTLAAKTRVIIDKDSTDTLNFSCVGDYS